MTSQTMISFKPKRALLSVSDKTGLVELAQCLYEQGVELVATGNTAALLRAEKFAVTDVTECTGFPEMLDGRVKTLHPAIHAGILARGKSDEKILQRHGIKPFDIIVVNLYPFEQTINHPDCDFDKALEHIDIGGPAMIRAAAKNYALVKVLVSPADYPELINYLNKKQCPANWPFTLAKKAFAHTASYDAAIANYLGTLNEERIPSGFPDTLTCQFKKQLDLRYGENPHQQAAFYLEKNVAIGALALATMLQGKELSYNNLLDADAAYACARSFAADKSVCVIVKHGNPCGIAQGENQLHAYLRAYQADPASSYGGIIAFNQCLQAETLHTLLAKQFVEVIIAPEITSEAERVAQGKPNMRVLITGSRDKGEYFDLDLRRIDGGVLVQEHDCFPVGMEEFRIVTYKQPSAEQKNDLLFAWTAVRHVKSNAIVFARELATIGIGAGQTSRIMSTRIALWQAEQAGFNCQHAAMASDAFIPFADNIEMAAAAGITAIIQPGGSIRDQEIINAANAAGITMVFTGYRHFRH